MKPRQDLKTAEIVNASLSVAMTHGVYFAARKLFLQSVPFDVTARVLLHPDKRRIYRPTGTESMDEVAEVIHDALKLAHFPAVAGALHVSDGPYEHQQHDDVVFRMDLVNRFNFMFGQPDDRVSSIQRNYLMGSMTNEDIEDLTRLYIYVLNGVDGLNRP